MAWTELQFGEYASDLVIGHLDFHFSNENSNITPGAQPFTLGTIVARPKGSAPTVAYAAIDAADDVVTTNEYAVVWGDHQGFKYSFTPKAIAAGKWNSIVIVRGAQFKEYYIKQKYATLLGAAPYALLKRLMADQGLLVLTDVSDTKEA